MKVVINSDFGGFGLSDDGMREYLKRKGFEYSEEGPDKYGFYHFIVNGEYLYDFQIARDDDVLVSVIEEMGEKAMGKFAALKIVEIPDNINWYVHEYDGREHVAERHRTWS